MQTKAEVIGRRHVTNAWRGKDRYYTWLYLPYLWPNKKLTMVTDGEDLLPYGTRTASAILVDVDPESLRHDGWGFVADLEVIDVWTEEGETEGDPGDEERDPESSS